MNKKSLMFVAGILTVGALKADIEIWPMFKYNTRRTGQSHLPGPDCCNEKWQQVGSGYFYSSPAVRIVGPDTIIYVGSQGGKLFAFRDLGPGNVDTKWNFNAGSELNSSPAVDADGYIYSGGNTTFGETYRVTPASSENWKYTVVEQVLFSSPVVHPITKVSYIGSAYLSAINDTKPAALYAINPDGSFRWKYIVPGHIYGSPTLSQDNATVYIGASGFFMNAAAWNHLDSCLYAIDTSGTFKWKFPTRGSVCSTPAVALDGTIYFTSWDENLYAVNPNGTLKWKHSIPGDTGTTAEAPPLTSSPAIGNDGTIYVAAVRTDTMHAIVDNGTSASRKWSTRIPMFAGVGSRWTITSSPALSTNGYVYIGVGNDHGASKSGLAILRQSNGSIVCTYTTPNEVWDSPAIGPNNTVYFGDCSGNHLYALQCGSTGNEEQGSQVTSDKLIVDNHPNPFTSVTFIEYKIGQFSTMETSPVSIKIYDLCGRLVKVLIDEPQEPGSYKISWNGTDDSGKLLPRGIYYYTAKCGEKSVTKKIILLR